MGQFSLLKIRRAKSFHCPVQTSDNKYTVYLNSQYVFNYERRQGKMEMGDPEEEKFSGRALLNGPGTHALAHM